MGLTALAHLAVDTQASFVVNEKVQPDVPSFHLDDKNEWTLVLLTLRNSTFRPLLIVFVSPGLSDLQIGVRVEWIMDPLTSTGEMTITCDAPETPLLLSKSVNANRGMKIIYLVRLKPKKFLR